MKRDKDTSKAEKFREKNGFPNVAISPNGTYSLTTKQIDELLTDFAEEREQEIAKDSGWWGRATSRRMDEIKDLKSKNKEEFNKRL